MIAPGEIIKAEDFTGLILMWAGAAAPTGWLICDGSAISRTTYEDLFAILGTTYGAGDGSTTFNLPDFRSSMPLGKGQKTRTMVFDAAAAVDPATDQITVTSNDWLHTGQPVALTGAGLPTGLSATTYYVIRVSATVIKLATSVDNANQGTAVDITLDGTGNATLTQVLTDRALGAVGGTETQTTVPRHHHTTNAELETSGSGSGGTSGGETPVATIDPTGENSPNNMPPYVVVNYIIKT